MNIKILSDSTCDLSPELIEKFHIGIFPLIVIKGDEEFLDGITTTPMDIFDHVVAGGALPSTAARSIVAYEEFFGKYAKEYDGVIHISVGATLSSCYQNACLAAEEFSNVRVVDSASLCTGQGLVVLKAYELAQTADSLDAVLEALDEYKAKVECSFVVDKLDYLVKGGRCSAAAALGANLLNLKPCIELKEGRLVVGKKYRGNFAKCLANYVKDRLEGQEDIDQSRIFLSSTLVDDDAYQAAKDAIAEYGNFDTVYETKAGCTISCHCGPGTLAIMFARK